MNIGSQQTPQHKKILIIGIKARLGKKAKGSNSVQRKSGGDSGGGRSVRGRGGVGEVQRSHNLLKAMRKLKSTIGNYMRYCMAQQMHCPEACREGNYMRYCMAQQMHCPEAW